MKKRKTRILTALSILVLILLIIYLKTDLLKTKEQLFWKYMIQNKRIIEAVNNESTKQYNQNLKESTYITQTQISVNTKKKIINPFLLYIEEKGNNQEQYSNTKVTFSINDEEKDIAYLIKDENYFLLNSNIFSNTFVGFENKNLKQLAYELGIKDTRYIPNEIKQIDYQKLFTINKEEQNHILKKYIPIFRKHIKNSNYIKNEKSNRNKTIEIQVSYNELNELLIDILENVYEDEQTLKLISNKFEIINSQSEYVDINKLKEKIDELVKNMKAQNYTDEKFLSIIIYIKEGNVINTEIVIKDNRTISIEYCEENNVITIKQYNVKNKELDLNSVSGMITFIFDSISEISYCRCIESNNISKVDVNIVINCLVDEIVVNYSSTQKMVNNINNIERKDEIEFIDLKELMNNVKKENIFNNINNLINEVKVGSVN